jgi:hypothetical protein
VWSVEPTTRKATWFVYGGEVDGEFGVSCGPGGSATAGDAPPKREALSPLLAEEVKAVVEKAKPYHLLVLSEREGSTLHLAFDYPLDPKLEAMDAAVMDDSIELTRAIFARQKDWAALRLEFRADWKDEFGRVERKPRVVVSMVRTKFDKIVWSELERFEVFRLFEVTYAQYPGLGLKVR